MGVKIFVRSMETKQYLCDTTEWCGDSSSAHRFTSAFEAEQFCDTHGLKSVEVVIVREDRPILIVPLRARRTAW